MSHGDEMYSVGNIVLSLEKRKEVLSHATSWMNPEDIMLSDVSQSQKDKDCMIPLI